MIRPDNFNEIAASLLLSDVELGLTFAQMALSFPEGERRSMAIRRAETAYREICGLECRVQMTDAERAQLKEKLEELQAALEEAGNRGSAIPSAS